MMFGSSTDLTEKGLLGFLSALFALLMMFWARAPSFFLVLHPIASLMSAAIRWSSGGSTSLSSLLPIASKVVVSPTCEPFCHIERVSNMREEKTRMEGREDNENEPLPKSVFGDPKTENLFIRGLASNSIVVCRCPVFFC